jgi:hypothetical protein
MWMAVAAAPEPATRHPAKNSKNYRMKRTIQIQMTSKTAASGSKFDPLIRRIIPECDWFVAESR